MKLTKRDVDDVYRLDFGPGTTPIILSEEEMDELRAHLQAERDEQLGRWRDPENPDIVCYPVAGDPDDIWVVYEGSGLAYMRERNQAFYAGNAFSEVAQRYFEAHPKPKTCDAAQPDEIWVLTINNDTEEVFRCGERGLYSLKTGNPLGSLLSCGSNKITAGHRVWPEGGDK